MLNGGALTAEVVRNIEYNKAEVHAIIQNERGKIEEEDAFTTKKAKTKKIIIKETGRRLPDGWERLSMEIDEGYLKARNLSVFNFIILPLRKREETKRKLITQIEVFGEIQIAVTDKHGE